MKIRKLSHSQFFILVIMISMFFSACSPIQTASPLPLSEIPPAVATPGLPWLQVYFTDPAALHASDYEGGPDETLAAAIDEARLSVDVAAYSLNLWSIRDALVHAYQRGVVVRMVMESDNMDDQEVQDLENAGIEIVGDQQEGLMHDKFVVIDRSEVWIGSMNYTVGGAYRDNNNLICIRSAEIADDYTAEFEQMFTDHLFGPYKESVIPNPKVTIDGKPVEVYFSPDGGVARRLVELISSAHESVYFMAFSFTANDIGEAVIERAQAGLKVAGVMDEDQIASNEGTEYDPFLQAGLDVRQDGNADGLMHHKAMILDRSIVITGSYNFTNSAEERNDENVVIIFSRDVAARYLEEFQRVYDQAQQPPTE